ncbi:MAG: S9 family peptidase [Ignavibacteria bacterium]|nr:S9 family peptidase [Ignavibacteria bacterium]
MKNEKFKNRNFPVLCSVLFAFSFLTVAKISPLMAQAKRPMELEDMFRVKRVSDPQLSPDGKWVAFVIAEVDKPNNKTNSDIWLIPSGGGEAKQLTSSPKHDRHPRWSPDGKWIAFESNRDGSYQIYLVSSSGGDAKQLTSISTDANQAVWSPDGKNIAFVSAVFPEFSDKPYKESDALNKKKQDARDNSNVKGRIMTKLLYRHWDSWVDDKRQHIFVVPIDGSADPRDVTPGDRDAIPTSSTFSAGDDFDFSPDGNELVYTATPIPPHEEAWSTNHDIFTVNLITGDRKQITTNLAADGFPRYSPDGKYIAYRAQSRRNFEADRWQLMLYDRAIGKTRSLTESFDSNIDAIQWTRDSKKVFFDAEEKANKPIWTVSIKGNDVKKTVDNAVNGDVTISSDGAMLVFSHASFMRPIEIYTASSDGKNLNQLTHVNDQLFSQISFTTPEYVWFTGANNTKVQMWVIKPPMFDEKKKYPFVFWVHGGPQGAFLNSWSYRWNPEVWASQGYVLALPNPRGSTGFGQKFTDEISHDWGGKVFDDLMNGLAYMEKLPYIDTTSMAAAGASYGGYMMNWFQGHTNKFKTLVTHDGVFNFASMYGTTEEVWFDEWEHGIPWENPDFDKFSPHKYAANFKTPNLIIHNELDYRVPLTEGQQLFTTLQRKGIPSKLLYFPDEGHWVLKPANSELWHKTIFEWLSEYLKPEGPHKNGSQ